MLNLVERHIKSSVVVLPILHILTWSESNESFINDANLSKPLVRDSLVCLVRRSSRSWPLSSTDSAWWRTIIPTVQSKSEGCEGILPTATARVTPFPFTGRAPAPPSPGWETASSSWHQLLSGGRRSCWDSTCMALISQPKGQSPSWAGGDWALPLWLYLHWAVPLKSAQHN